MPDRPTATRPAISSSQGFLVASFARALARSLALPRGIHCGERPFGERPAVGRSHHASIPTREKRASERGPKIACAVCRPPSSHWPGSLARSLARLPARSIPAPCCNNLDLGARTRRSHIRDPEAERTGRIAQGAHQHGDDDPTRLGGDSDTYVHFQGELRSTEHVS